jgi:putative transposase
VKANLAQREAERSYGIPGQELTPAAGWSAWELRKEFNQVKDSVAPWWREASKEACASGLANLAQALGNWKASRNGTRHGPVMRFPVFKGRRSGLSVRFSTGAFGLPGGMCGCPGSGWCAPMSPPARWPAASGPGPRGSGR